MPRKNTALKLPQAEWFAELEDEFKHETKDETEKFQTTIPAQELFNALATIRLDAKYSDLTIVCADEVHAVHKCLVCTRSGFFAKVCESGFLESSTNRVILNEEEPALVKQMVNYLYTLDYQVGTGNIISDRSSTCEKIRGKGLENDVQVESSVVHESKRDESQESTKQLDGGSESSATWDPLSFHILMYSLADRMIIEGLKALSRCKAERELRQRLDAPSFSGAVLEIYTTTPEVDRGLRDLAVKLTMEHLTELRTGNEHSPAALQNCLLESVPQFSHDLLVAVLDKTVSEWNQYGRCKTNWSARSGTY